MPDVSTVKRSAHRNTFSTDDLARIAASASSLEERLAARVLPLADDEAAAARIAEWKQSAASGDEILFQRRLAWSGLDEQRLRQLLGGARLPEPVELPHWTDVLEELTSSHLPAELQSGADDAWQRFFDFELELPFQELLAEFVVIASRRLAAKAAPHLKQLGPDALAGLERALLKRIAVVSAQCLYHEFSIFRSQRMSGIDFLFARTTGEIGREVYQEFVHSLRNGGWKDFFVQYAALARLLVTIVEYWIDSSAEFLDRLAADHAAIERVFNHGEPPGQVRELLSLLSDSHHRGRMVIVATFENGLKLVYKPRDISIEQSWFNLLEWTNAEGGLPELARLRLLARDGYGWVEFISRQPCLTADEAKRFYERTGMLIALVYALGGSDFHYENFIASGEHPILIDLEAIMQHSPRENFTGQNVEAKLERSLADSVLRTGMLPRWQIGLGNRAIDVSALGAVVRQDKHVPIQVWKDINTDLMEPLQEFGATQPGANAPTLGENALSPNDYVNEIEEGFRRMYRFLAENRERLIAADGPLTPFQDQSVRYIFRPTAAYYDLLLNSVLPSAMREGVDRSIRLDRLAASMVSAEERPLAWALIDIERLALSDCDFPIFTAKANGTALDAECGGMDGLFIRPCFDEVVRRLKRLSENDLEKQSSLIRAALASRLIGQQVAAPVVDRPGAAAETAERASTDELLARAVEIGERLLQAAIHSNEDELVWITLSALPGQHRFQLDGIGPDVFEGGCGIALLFAGLAQLTGEARWRDAAHAVLTPILCDLDETAGRRGAQLQRLHGLSGWASLGFALPRLSSVLGAADISQALNSLLSLMTPANIRGDRNYDVLNGAAGTLLSMASAWQATQDRRFLDCARACGEHLIDARRATQSGLLAWTTLEDQFMLGLSHGAAGIACSLLRLGTAANDDTFIQAAGEAIRYEQSTFSAAHGNWPDLRWKSDSPNFMASDGWCHGGPGIALARLSTLDILDTPAVREDIQAGVKLARNLGPHRMDHLCCGNTGRLSILLEAGLRFADEALLDFTYREIQRLLRSADVRGAYRLWHQQSGCVSMPGLFQGLSGIGYTLLRFSAPQTIPGVLLL
jgi:type 2 lantibiotic biosynthesis protein LanM